MPSLTHVTQHKNGSLAPKRLQNTLAVRTLVLKADIDDTVLWVSVYFWIYYKICIRNQIIKNKKPTEITNSFGPYSSYIGFPQEKRSSSCSISIWGTVCSLRLTSCSAFPVSSVLLWNHGWMRTSAVVSLSPGSFLSRLRSRQRALKDSPSGRQYVPRRILENRVAGSGSWKG